MSIADLIAPTLAARQARAAALAAERAARDAFIQAQFPLLDDQFESMLRAGLGLDARIVIQVNPVTYTVQGRSFASLTVNTWTAAFTLDGTTRSVTFTPALDFHERDQFGLIACTLDFPYTPGRSRTDKLARVFLERGIQMRGTSIGNLLLPLDSGVRPLGVSDIEDIFSLWWLRS